MDNATERLGNNIRLMRKAHGDTQVILADIIGVSTTALSNYENGKRHPDDTILNAIAFRYQCPVDYLKTGDFSFLSTTSTVFNNEDLFSLIDVALPVIQIDESKCDFFFNKGYEYTKETLSNMKIGDGDIAMHNFEKAFEAYETSLKESKTIESAANLLCLYFLLQSMLVIDDYIDVESESIQYDSNGSVKVSKFIPRIFKEYSVDEAEEKRDLYREIRKKTGRYILKLKKTYEYSDLADFYIALRYVYSVDKSSFGQDTGKLIGLEMMKAFMRFGNKYAKAYIKTIEKAMYHE